MRAMLVCSHFVGLAILRFVGRVEPLASAPVDDLFAAVGPTVRRYLTGGLQPGQRGQRATAKGGAVAR